MEGENHSKYLKNTNNPILLEHKCKEGNVHPSPWWQQECCSAEKALQTLLK